MRYIIIIILGLVAASPSALATAAKVPDEACAALLRPVRGASGGAQRAFLAIPDAPTVLTEAALVPAAGQLPVYCRVGGSVSPQIGFEARLPSAGWNGKFLMQGCGGMCGVLNMAAAEDSLARGYAVVNTDMGHKGQPSTANWAYNNLPAEIDFAYRSTYVVSRVAKALIKAYYGEAPRRSYFNGCSTGGRQAMIAAQRFPEEFDGIIAGAPVLNQSGVGALHLAWTARANVAADGRPILDAGALKRVRAAVLERCDALDGARDGILQDPEQCPWTPADLACKAGGPSGDECLDELERAALARIYGGARDSADRPVWNGGGLPFGSEYEWVPAFAGAGGNHGFIIAEGGMLDDLYAFKWFYPDAGPGHSISDFDFDRDPPRLALNEALYNAQNPDLRRFRARGGKLIGYHGWDDIEIPARLFVDYYELTARAMGGLDETREFFRLFMVPGMAHCRRGVGADAIDYLSYLEDWVERGVAPDSMLAHKLVKDQAYNGLPRPRYPLAPSDFAWTRPVYAYPSHAVRIGHGDWQDPANWRPSTPAKDRAWTTP